MELNSTIFNTLVIQYVEAVYMTKSCFVFAFCQISLHPCVSGLRNFPLEVERRGKNFCTRVYRNCEHVGFSLRYDKIWLGGRSEIVIKRNLARIFDDSVIDPSASSISEFYDAVYLRKHRGAHTIRITAIFHNTCTGCSKIIRRYEGYEERTGNNENISRKGRGERFAI